ncbi:hypothetical protein FHG66_12020 [Rubellimicrobium rubrum]|uniref:Uncharacterized protein n=1 Tax=Rubellimicrobium rubrum TaxID=2585369 RepID=A0A5C4MTF8_9RHOB|nr:hypothetical protein [Rubellimicrobium rubrum]TNC49169.1 hypothetical protein FHG66_12020 [Rubellimicrobium rubrum]
MKRLALRRNVLMAAGTAAVMAVAASVSTQQASAQPAHLSGTVGFAGGVVIPNGEIEIYIEDPAARDDAGQRAAETRVESDGKSKAIGFSLSGPKASTASPNTRIVARLERADGWLLARGSATVGADAPVHITLHTVMY